MAETATSDVALQAALSAMLEEPQAGPDLIRTLRLLQAPTSARSGRAVSALAINDLLLAAAPGYVPALYAPGRALRELGRLDEAMGAMRSAQALLPQAAVIDVGIAQVLRGQGRDAAALAELAPALLPGHAAFADQAEGIQAPPQLRPAATDLARALGR